MKTIVLNVIDDSKFNLLINFLQEFKFVWVVDEKPSIKKMEQIPNSILNPISVNNFKMFSRDELHDR